ncbi:Reticulon-4 receptor 2 [Fasciolopsis buskii]|uniref:Reticulon-4 receptor 2 n=1 Tax=Fasciolopsis buskii TaxID=27845 RepID=A0A8E0RT13_9TREM|nr:Reticulon-4 receptor 2 [Fasciolopsis buski]
MKHYLCSCLIVTVFLLSLPVSKVRGERSSCPIQCICVENRMNCERSGLKSLPPPFRLHLETLHVANQTFDKTRLGPSELAVYTSPEYGGQVILKKLFIRFCNIKSIEPKAFRALGSTLEMVDLSGNPLINIGAYAFAGLGPLTLVLDYIEQPEFDNEAFEDCRIKSLMMQYSNLTTLPIQPLLSLATKGRLEKLLLRGNRFRHLDSECERLFDRLIYFELDENPWHCDCQLTWLIRRYRLMLESRTRGTRYRGPQSDTGPEINQPRCSSPQSLVGRRFTDLITDMSEVYGTSPSVVQSRVLAPPTILHCAPPQIERLDIDLEQFIPSEKQEPSVNTDHQREELKPTAHLRCAVRGSAQLSVVWRYHHPGLGPTSLPNTSVTKRQGYDRINRLPVNNNFDSWLDGRHEAETALRVEKSGELDIYSCLGQDVIGNVSALIRIQWPLNPIYAPKAISPVGSINQGEETNMGTGNHSQEAAISPDWATKVIMSSQSALYAPQFSLSQLLGAIAGTFLSTVLLFFIVHWTLHCRMTERVQHKQFPSEKQTTTNLVASVGLSPAGTSSSSSNTKLVSTVKINDTSAHPSSTTIPMQINPEALSLNANLFNAHAYHQLINGGLPNMDTHTMPIAMSHGVGGSDQTKSTSQPEDGSTSQSTAYEPVAYSEAKPITYDIPWMVNIQHPQSRGPNEQQIPLLLSGMLTDVNRYVETPVSSHSGLIQSALMIPPPPPIPQPSLPPSAQSSLTLTNGTCTRNPSMTPKDSNLFALQATGYPYPGIVTNSALFDSSPSST